MSHDGKLAIAPCGHLGRHVFGTFVVCLSGCDSCAPSRATDEVKCPRCGSADVDDFSVDPMYYAFNPSAVVGDLRCVPCGHVFMSII